MSACVLPFPAPTDLDGWVKEFISQFAKALVDEVRAITQVQKEWYSVDELAKALGKSPFTVREKWCNAGRIDAEKDTVSGKWRIPGPEYRRLVGGGLPRKAT